MNSMHLNLETVTPMFLHGANSRSRLELRSPPFKALFRYWWRATQSITRADDLRKAEGQLFGKTRQKSPLLIRLSFSEELTDEYQPLPHHTGSRCANCSRQNKECKQAYTRNAYCPGQKFTIKLTADNLTDYQSIAKLGFLLGGVGNRSRRGFGSVRETSWFFQDVPDLRSEIFGTLNSIAPGQFTDNGHSIESAVGLLAYPVIHKIFFGQPMPSNDPMPLLRTIGQATHDHYDEHNNALGYARGPKRMASPIHVGVQKVGNNYLPIVTQLHWRYPGYTSADPVRQQAFINQIIS